MELSRIFVKDQSEEGLWSIQCLGQLQNEFDKFFDRVNDIEWLHDFFEKNKDDLTSGYFNSMTVSKAVLKTLEEAQEMEDVLYDYAEQGFAAGDYNLQHLFKALDNFEYTIRVHQKSKARVRKGWLRLYAIRLATNCYLVTGGAIKLTGHMQRDHLATELGKLSQTTGFLRNHGIIYPDDLNNYYNNYKDE